MKNLVLLFCALYFSTNLLAQISRTNVGNEWIDYDLTYHKFSIAEDGLYRITPDYLDSIGLSDINLEDVALYNLGAPVPTNISEEGILFYGKKNRGDFDRLAFKTDSDQLNTRYSLISDTAAYFLVVDPSSSNVVNSVDYSVTSDDQTPISYLWKEQSIDFTNALNKPQQNSSGAIRFSDIQVGEGFALSKRNKFSSFVRTPNLYKGDANIEFAMKAVTNIADNHAIELNIGDQQIARIEGSKEFIIDTSFVISNESVDAKVLYSIQGMVDKLDRFSLANITVKYPKEPLFEGDRQEFFRIPASNNVTSVINIRGFDPAKKYLIYNLSADEVFIPAVGENGIIALELPASDSEINLLITEASNINKPKYNYTKKFEALSAHSADYVVISHDKFINAASNPIQQYIDYRASNEGGNFTTQIIDVQDIYDQYGYGINGHFYALRNLGKNFQTGWTNLKHIFIIGKGVNYSVSRSNDAARARNYVPTYGFPTSDNLLFSDNDLYSNISVGRIAVEEPPQVIDYLEKVKIYEGLSSAPQTVQDKAWMKNVFQLAGGQSLFLDYLKLLGNILENNLCGFNLFTFSKIGSASVDNSFFQSSYDIINNGVSIINFMGHASVSVFEANLDNPENYDNDGKTPLFFTMGCYSGDICSNTTGISESFVNIPKKGAIAFIANTWQSYPSDHYAFGKNVFGNMGGEMYGGRLGEILKNSLAQLPNASSAGRRSFIQQLFLNGDPALKVISFEGPDYVVDYSSIKISNTPVVASSQDFEVCYDIINLGRHDFKDNLPTQLPINIKHLRPNQSIKTDTTIMVPMRKSIVNTCIRLPLTGDQISGKNSLQITIDPDNIIDEAPLPAAKNNNVLNAVGEQSYVFNVLSEGHFATLPLKYSIVSNSEISFMATNYNFFQKPSPLIFQIDTVPTFDSPMLTESIIPKSNIPIEWTYKIPEFKDQVFYWRISPDTTQNGMSPVWDESSFIYSPDESQGWNQSHWGQYDDNELTNLTYNSNNEAEFVARKISVTFQNSGRTRSRFFINGNRWDVWRRNVKSGIMVTVFNPRKYIWVSYKGLENYGAVNTKGNTFYFEFPADTEESEQNIVDMLKAIPDELTFMIQTTQLNSGKQYPLEFLKTQYENNTGLLKYLESLGAQRIPDLINRDHVPYSFVYRKGSGVISELISESKEEDIEGNFIWNRLHKDGSIKTDYIGPASKFHELRASGLSSEKDSTSYSIYLIDKEGIETPFITNHKDSILDLSSIDTELYPYLRAELILKDFGGRIPELPNYFRVLYNPAPDVIVQNLGEITEEIDQGDSLRIDIGLHNISDKDINTLFDLSFTTIDEKNNKIKNAVFYDKLNARDSIKAQIKLSTKSLKGDYTLIAHANEDRNILERNYLNNFGLFKFKVLGDQLNPEMNVTFDGRKIYNNEIVQPNPQISVKFEDNKLYVFDADSSNFEVSLCYPDKTEKNVMEEFPDAQIIHNREQEFSELKFSPRLEDGIYTLKARTVDHSNNKSNPYKIAFRVINEEGVSRVFNYPNPFSTSTQFIFTLTGSSVPDDMVLRVYTTSGKVVREFTKNELGNLRIGLNKTQFKWDGTDEYGNKLANGVYLYKLEVKNEKGENFKIFKDEQINSQDKYFTNGFGKLVIMR